MAQDGATAGQVQAWNGSTWAPSTVGGAGATFITPSQITSDQTDYAPTGWDTATHVRLSGDNGIRAIRSFNTASVTEKILINVGSFPIYIAPEHASGTAAQRVSYFEEIFIPPAMACRIYYDSTLSRWVPASTPAPNYFFNGHCLFIDKPAGKFPEGLLEDSHLTYSGSGNVNTTTPTATIPFVSWQMDNGTNATGDMCLYFSKTTDAYAYASTSHIVNKCTFFTPSALSNGTQRYRIRHILSALPGSLLTNVNNTAGIRYSDDLNSGKFELYCRDNSGTETTADSGVTVSVSTMYDTAVSINKSRNEVTFWINGAVVGRITVNLPQAGVIGGGIQFMKTVGTGTVTFYAQRLMAAAITI